MKKIFKNKKGNMVILEKNGCWTITEAYFDNTTKKDFFDSFVTAARQYITERNEARIQ